MIGIDTHDFSTHRRAWRSAIVEMKRIADDGPDAGDQSYWKHELEAFDRAFALIPEINRLLDKEPRHD